MRSRRSSLKLKAAYYKKWCFIRTSCCICKRHGPQGSMSVLLPACVCVRLRAHVSACMRLSAPVRAVESTTMHQLRKPETRIPFGDHPLKLERYRED